MKKLEKTLLASAFLGAIGSAQAAPQLVPNGDFSTSAGDDWTQAGSEGTVISYLASGGSTLGTNGGSTSDGGYAEIDNSAGAWGVLVSEGGTGANPATGGGIELSALGLTAGETYTFSLDVIDFGVGGTTAGIKLESWSDAGYISDSGDQLFPATTSWSTFTHDYTIAANATRLKVVPVVSGASAQGVIGFDNVGFDDSPTGEVEPPFDAQIPNGDFEIPDGESWTTAETTPVYFTTGGNPGGYVELDFNVGAFANLQAFDGAQIPFASLGLEPGDTFLVQWDMRNVTGTNIGGIRLLGDAYNPEFYPAEVIGNGSTWETYSVEITVPAAPAQASFGLRPGFNTTNAFDNVMLIFPQQEPFCAEVVSGTMVNWTPTSASSSYQPQKSDDGVTFTNLGPAIAGDSVSSVYDAEPSAFYQVVEATIDDSDDIVNGGFESVDPFDSYCAEAWTCFTGVINDQFATRLATDNTIEGTIATPDQVRTGVAALQLKVVNAETEALPGKSLTQQNVLNSNGSITPGNTYTFSFWAKQVSTGPSYVQGYKIAWLDENGGIVGTGAEAGFSGGDGEWAEISAPGLVAPANATSALIEIFGATGAVDGGFGEVLLDDISLVTEGSTPIGTLEATTSPGVGVTYPTLEGFSYQVQASTDLITFEDLGDAVIGDGGDVVVGESAEEHKFFQVVKTELP